MGMLSPAVLATEDNPISRKLAAALYRNQLNRPVGADGSGMGLALQQAGILDGGTSLGEREQLLASPSMASGGGGGGMWQSQSPAKAGLAQALMQDRQAAAAEHQRQALAAQKTNNDMVDSFGGVKETKKDRRDFLLQVLGLVR